MSNKEFHKISNKLDTFLCIDCIQDNLPFTSLDLNSFRLLNLEYNTKSTLHDETPSGTKSIHSEFFCNSNRINFPLDDDEEHHISIDSQYYNIDEFNEICCDNSSSFKVGHINIASLNKNADELYNFLSLLNHTFDVIGITEHKIGNFYPINNFELPGYNFCFNTTQSTHGGTGFYISSKFNFKEREDLNISLSGELESTIVEILFENKQSIICGCIYKHPHMSVNEFNDNYLLPLLDKISNLNKKCLLVGDFNIDLLKSHSKDSFGNFYNNLTSYFFLPFILQPTRVTEHSKTLIDNIFFNSLEYNSCSGNITVQISDHLFQFLILKDFKKADPNVKCNLYKHDYSFFNKDELQCDLLQINWQNFITTRNRSFNENFYEFFKTLESIINDHAPIKKLTKKEVSLKSKPWINKQIQTKMKQRDRTLKKYYKEKDNDLKNTLWNQYKLLRNSTCSEMKKGKQDYFRKFFSENQSNIANIWKGIRSIISYKSQNSKKTLSLYQNKSLVSDPSEIVQIFNEYFVSVGPKLASKIATGKKTFSSYLENAMLNSVYLKPTTEEEISKIISNLNVKKATGPNSVPIFVLKDNKNILSSPISQLINQSFDEGMFPDLCKIAEVIPVHKKGDSTTASNYRPISLLSVFSKIFEKCMYTRLYEFLEKHQLIYNRQFGFRAHHSTSHALCSLIELIKTYLDDGNFVCGIFIDLQKAFDTVDHEILMQKLWHYGIRGTAHEWLKSFLTKRKQYVCLNGFKSQCGEIKCGVPQGSTLGPLLFLIYINDLNNIFQKSIVHHFADDTNLLYANKKIATIENVMNSELKHLVEWLKANRLSLNETKTDLIIFHSSSKNITDITIKLNKCKLKPCDSVKYLGVIIDKHLTWTKQVVSMCEKISRFNGIISNLRHVVPLSVSKSIYHSLIYSCITYGCLVWSFTTKGNLEKNFKQQKKCTRIITFSDFHAHTNPLFESLKILKLEDIVFLEILKFMFDIKEKQAPEVINELFTPNASVHHHHTRGIYNFHLPSVKSSQYGLMSLRMQGGSLWNNFLKNNTTLTEVCSRKLFTSKVKNIFLSKYSSVDNEELIL